MPFTASEDDITTSQYSFYPALIGISGPKEKAEVRRGSDQKKGGRSEFSIAIVYESLTTVARILFPLILGATLEQAKDGSELVCATVATT
jgi:hypothetical protein